MLFQAGKVKVLHIAKEPGRTNQKTGKSDRFEQLIETEWLLSNRRGSFCSGTVAGCNTRRYHSLLIGSLTPPAQRTVALSACAETIHTPRRSYSLSHFEFDPPAAEPVETLPVKFSKDVGVHFEYSTEDFSLTKSIYLLPEADIVGICYEFKDVEEEFEFTVRPFAAMRDYHSLKKATDEFYLEWSDEFLAVKSRGCRGQLSFASEEMTFIEEQQWWYNFFYRQEKQRGYDYREDLFSPGVFRRTIDGPAKIVLWAGFGPPVISVKMTALDVDVIIDDLKLRAKQVLEGLRSEEAIVAGLAASANEFVIDRQTEKVKTKSILAGFPWFMDWGRDAFIALEGILLCSGRYEDAAGVLLNFAYHADEGMIPNCFGDYGSGSASLTGGGAQFNSIDASLWFIHAAFKYYKASGNIRIFSSRLMPVIRWIVDSYCKGTKFGIRADSDGLITGGSADTQLTWMDAKVDNFAVTPRYGKAVEVNALWYNAICNCSEFYRAKDACLGRQFTEMAERIASSFRSCFWFEKGQCLYDCVTDSFKDESIRPNQIFAISLPFSPLAAEQQKAVVDCVEKELLTPYGLRTLSPKDSRYKGRYEGDVRQRDLAYHQGTVWPFLMGAFIEAYLKVNDLSKASRKNSLLMLKPLLKHFKNDSCAGSVSEIFDGDEPHKPRGAFAQAWSVAELLRAYLLIHS